MEASFSGFRTFFGVNTINYTWFVVVLVLFEVDMFLSYEQLVTDRHSTDRKPKSVFSCTKEID